MGIEISFVVFFCFGFDGGCVYICMRLSYTFLLHIVIIV